MTPVLIPPRQQTNPDRQAFLEALERALWGETPPLPGLRATAEDRP